MATSELLLLIALLLHEPLASVASPGFRVGLTHVDSARPFAFTERFHRAVRRSWHRREVLDAKMSSSRSGIAASVEWGDGEYLIDLAIGTPMLPITAVLDTGSDLTWTQCGPCFECLPQPSPYYDPSDSSTFAVLPCPCPSCTGIPTRCTLRRCHYNVTYEDGTISLGFLATEALTFGRNTSVAGFTFGCSTRNTGSLSNSTGIVGMGRGPLSLPSQLHPSKFSYCLTPFNSSATGHLFLGSMADLGGGFVHSTPIVLSPNNYSSSSFYYLSLQGISVGHTLLPIPNTTFQLKADGSGGLIVDSGSSVTSLEEAGYDILRKELISLVHLPVANQTSTGLDLCFSLPPGSSSPPAMPDMIFHFDGADMTIPPSNYMYSDFEQGLFCLVITRTTGTSVLGNYQQQNLHVLFDLDSDVLSFVPAMCDGL
ncbi:unnamed protein product [Musa acuminata subsp. malaccensis]|uniref:(wild Malaysian banana) hypothetical protein n=1 Tax=Musa acuminata subsp. malaccensis TaxID=214687 RepID=A0A804KHQ3_MUSAM|nr:PREDICTED: aspartic proteinase nepenthesin-1-like [Musa acuminata subsp. malaccensis]CAG1834674.1 unnamed protein product [Musa acuminata subsp. malaccensis]